MRPSVRACVPEAREIIWSMVSRWASQSMKGGAATATARTRITMDAMIVRISRKRLPSLRSLSGLSLPQGQRKRESHSMPSGSKRADLARIHDVVRVDGLFQDAHEVESGRSMLKLKIFHLFLADSVLAGAGALHGERPL